MQQASEGLGLTSWLGQNPLQEGLEGEIISEHDVFVSRDRRRNRLGTDLHSRSNRSAGLGAPNELGPKESDFQILHRPGQRQRLARQGTKEIQVRVQESR